MPTRFAVPESGPESPSSEMPGHPLSFTVILWASLISAIPSANGHPWRRSSLGADLGAHRRRGPEATRARAEGCGPVPIPRAEGPAELRPRPDDPRPPTRPPIGSGGAARALFPGAFPPLYQQAVEKEQGEDGTTWETTGDHGPPQEKCRATPIYSIPTS